MQPQSLLPASLGKEVYSIKLPDMPRGAVCVSATIHKNTVYISVVDERLFGDEEDEDSNEGDDTVVEDSEVGFFYIFSYSTKEHKWSTLPVQQVFSAITCVNDRITLIGGRDVSKGDTSTSTLSTWYEEEGQWRQVLPPMPTRRDFSAVISHDNLVLVTGGGLEDDSIITTADVLDLTTMKWTTPEGLNLPVPLKGHHLVFCGEYLYLVGGGFGDFNTHAWRTKWSDVKQAAASQHYQPKRSVWNRIADPPTLVPTAVSCGGTLYAVGGETKHEENVRGVFAYDITRNHWVYVGDMSVARFGHCAVPLGSNSLFVAGGCINEAPNSFLSSAELLVL